MKICTCRVGSTIPDGQHFLDCPLFKTETNQQIRKESVTPEKQEGPHIIKCRDEQGPIEYDLKNGVALRSRVLEEFPSTNLRFEQAALDLTAMAHHMDILARIIRIRDANVEALKAEVERLKNEKNTTPR